MATQPKKQKNQRITSPGEKVKKKRGRPRGTRLKRKFEETRLGFMLKYETPLEYDIIMGSIKKTSFMSPDASIIEAVASASPDESFKKDKFKRYLSEYKETGIHCDRPKVLTPSRAAYYESVRKNKIKAYMVGNKTNLKKIFKINGGNS